jgi:hypothetical protein
MKVERQTPGCKGIWNNYQFLINQQVDECDYWVVYEGLLYEDETVCPIENMIFITAEPPTIREYNQNFLDQFAVVITCHEGIKHKNKILQQQSLPWHIGRKQKNDTNLFFSKNYDELKSINSHYKDKSISVVSSTKTMTKGHRRRNEFIQKLKDVFGNQIDVFGKGNYEIEDKWDAISRYKYHIVIENSALKNYWTEKLSDAYLGGAYPIYYGCNNLHDYFPKKSFTRIDINNTEKSIKVIKNVVKSNTYEKSKKELFIAKELVLDKYNLFAMIYDICSKKKAELDKICVKIKPEKYLSKSILKQWYSLIKNNFSLLKKKI